MVLKKVVCILEADCCHCSAAQALAQAGLHHLALLHGQAAPLNKKVSEMEVSKQDKTVKHKQFCSQRFLFSTSVQRQHLIAPSHAPSHYPAGTGDRHRHVRQLGRVPDVPGWQDQAVGELPCGDAIQACHGCRFCQGAAYGAGEQGNIGWWVRLEGLAFDSKRHNSCAHWLAACTPVSSF